MRLDRLLPLPTPLREPGRKDDRPPRRQPGAPEASGRGDPPADARAGDSDERPASPDHLDITV